MVVDVKLCRAEGQPFGFRLIGGRDFEIPLTVSRVVESSIAQASGLREGDVVVRINDDPTIEMTHEDAHVKLVAAGNEFVLGVLRATDVLAQQEASVESQEEIEIQQELDKIIPDKPVTDEEIAELLSGEAEVLKEHGVLGVNFNRMMPKSGVFKRSEVFQVLNDEQLKSESENEQTQRWTTFLQKPNRPVPPPKNFQTITNTYKPIIVKQPKPKCAPDYRVTPSPSPQPIEVQKEEIIKQEETENEIEVKVEENCCCEEAAVTKCKEIVVAEVSSETVCTTTTMTSTETTVVTFEEIAADATGEEINEELVAEEIKSQSDEVSVVSSAFAEQLANVQSQLMALSHLPKTIQSTLDEITKQLQSLIPTPKSKQKSAEPENKTTTTEEEKVVTNEDAKVASVEEQKSSVEEETTVVNETTINQEETVTVMEQESLQATTEQQEVEHHPTNDQIEEYEESQRKFRELWEKKREKQEQTPVDPKNELTAELKQKVTEDRTIKQKKAKNFRGLQPSERPIILPGGRKWKNAKDAMNDELIAEIISSQAELIMGTTLGVNFLKYQKPEKDLSFLKNSETYRTIHHLGQHENGIEKRPAMVVSEEDILKCASPHPLNQNNS